MKTVLVVANETLGGTRLLERARELAAEEGDLRLVICVPRSRPRHGSVIYDDAVFQAAQVRIDLARQVLREEGIEAIGEIGDPDPYTAAMDAIAEHAPHHVIVSTLPATTSGWLKRDLVERIADASDLPVEHVVTDIDEEGLPFGVTLVVANRTASGAHLLPKLKERAERDEGPHLFIVVVPQEGGEGIHARRAAARLAELVDRMRAEHLVAAGMIGPPDPFVATMNGLQFFQVDDVLISTLPVERSGWMRAHVIERVRKASHKPVEHVVAEQAESPAAA